MNRSKMSSPSTPCPFIGQVSVYCPPVQLYSDGHGTGSVVEGSRNDLVESGDGGDTTTTIHLSGGTRSRILREQAKRVQEGPLIELGINAHCFESPYFLRGPVPSTGVWGDIEVQFRGSTSPTPCPTGISRNSRTLTLVFSYLRTRLFIQQMLRTYY